MYYASDNQIMFTTLVLIPDYWKFSLFLGHNIEE